MEAAALGNAMVQAGYLLLEEHNGRQRGNEAICRVSIVFTCERKRVAGNV